MQQLDISKLKTKFSGNIIVTGDAEYDAARVTFVVKDARPAAIAQAKTNQDVAAAITFAKERQLQISVRSGGHSAGGFSTNTDGLVLDLSLMNSVEVLDEKAGLVRLGSGVLWGDVAKKLAEYGLALSSGDTKSVAVGGLTLGGGIGWMVRKYGYTIDSLVAADVVLADGSVVRASGSEHSDLFWGLRGGGGNFGVVTSFEFQAHPRHGKVVQSTLTYDTAELQNVITGWRDHVRSAPEDLTSFLLLMPGFGDMAPAAMITSCYASDDLARANQVLEPFRHLSGMKSDATALKEYADILQETRPPEGMRLIVKSMFAKTLSDDLAGILAVLCCKPGSPMVQLRMVDGAPSRVAPEDTALPHRDSEIFLFAAFAFPPGTTEEQERQSLAQWDKLAHFSTGAYGNFLSTNTEEDVARIYPEETYERLAKLKRTYDPENIFNHNFNIKPAEL